MYKGKNLTIANHWRLQEHMEFGLRPRKGVTLFWQILNNYILISLKPG